MNEGALESIRRGSPDISPITASPRTSSGQSQTPLHTSSIPVRKGSQGLGGAGTLFSGWKGRGVQAESANRDSSLTRWDDFSGEPTTSDTGKPAQAIPGVTRFDSQGHRWAGNNGNSALISGGNTPRLVSPETTPKKAGTNAGDKSLAIRDEWKGASGRSAIVKPLTDKLRPQGQTLYIPPGSRSQPNGPAEQRSFGDLPAPGPGHLTACQNSPLSSLAEDDDGIRPPVPLKIGRRSPSVTVTSITAQEAPEQSGYPSPAMSDTRSPLARNPSNEKLQVHPISTSADIDSRDGNMQGLGESGFGPAVHTRFEGQPSSRFSTTTYATTAYESPPATPGLSSEPPMPDPLTPMVNRRRPVPVAGVANGAVTARKPTPSDKAAISKADAERRYSKTLPKSPPEVEAVDRVSSLQARLDDLHRRRRNLQTVIHELTHVVQPSSIAYDMASRQEIKRTVDALNSELAEVVKEEHETGLQLHRAWKRQDRDAYEPAGLWVRRVTG